MRSLLIAWAIMLACAVAVLCLADGPAEAQLLPGHISIENGVGPVAPCAFTDASGRPVLCSSASPQPVGDAANASYGFAPAAGAAAATSSTAASYTFATTDAGAARGWFADCPATASGTVVMLAGVGGGAIPTTLYPGHYGPVAERIAGFSGNSGTCTIGLEF